jgi:LasA protease
MINRRLLFIQMALGISLLSCTALAYPVPIGNQSPSLLSGHATPTSGAPTSLPTRPNYAPGQLVDYVAQPGDTLAALAAHFNTTVPEITAANPIIPADATTMPPGLPMKIPIYFKALWAYPFKIVPDAAFVDGPMQIGFNTSAFVQSQPGWLKNYHGYSGAGDLLTGAELVDYVAINYSVSPRLLLALLEYKSGALSNPSAPPDSFILGYQQTYYSTLYLQLVLAANTLNNGYYGWRGAKLTEFDLPDGTLIRPDPWQNAASVAIQYFFSRTDSQASFDMDVGSQGLAAAYRALFGDPWAGDINFIPGSLKQPALRLPFPPDQTWTYTGAPHTGWGLGDPFAAIDFAPPSGHHGCFTPDPQNFVTAVADGLIVRSGPDGLALDLDGDGDERTGWVIFYLHLSATSRPPAGQMMHAGDRIGEPSCQGGELVTGTHVHIARKYNGEWILADSPIPFDLSGWITHSSGTAYQGTLTRNGLIVKACTCSDIFSNIQADPLP